MVLRRPMRMPRRTTPTRSQSVCSKWKWRTFRYAARTCVLLGLLFCPASVLGASLAGEPPTIVPDTVIITGNGSSGPYLLSGYFSVVGTEQLVSGTGLALDSTAFHIDYDRGLVSFRDPLTVADTITITFQRLAFVLPHSFSERTAIEAFNAGLGAAAVTPILYSSSLGPNAPTPGVVPGSRMSSASTIRWQGFKSFSLSTSNGGKADWSQGLELSVDGEIAEGVQMRAAISDRYSDAATTRGYTSATRLGDLDRFYLETQSARVYGRFGQLSLNTPMSGSTARQATGATFRWKTGTHAIGGYVGRVTSRPGRVRLDTQPNVAGPYRLSDAGIGDVVTASVVITLDGRRLREGADDDFTFDASTSSISFGPRSLPSIGSVVIAEFERSQDEYHRTLAGSSWGWTGQDSHVANRLEWNWEADDPDAPLLGELTAAQRSILAQDADGRVAVPAYELRGSNEGDYGLTVRGDDDTVFVYIGPGNGQWRVGFEYVGPDKGRYRHLAESAYEYVGVGNGSYEPISTLGAPRSLMTVGESFRLDATPLGSFDGTWYGVAADPNRLAGDNTTLTSSHHTRWSAHAVPADHVDNLQVDWWRTEASMERGRSADDLVRFTNAWNLRDARFDSSRSEYQVRVSSKTTRPIFTSVESAMLRSGSLSGVRWDANAGARPFSSLTLRAGWTERHAQDGNIAPEQPQRLWEYRSSARWKHGPIGFMLTWREQHLHDSTRVFDQQPQYFSDKSAAVSVSHVRLEYRWRDSFDSLKVRQRLREIVLSAPLTWHRNLDGDLVVARGVEARGASGFSPYYRGRLDGSWRPVATATIRAEMDLAYTRSGSEQEIYLPTRPGQGQYRFERGEYVPDAHGDYRRVVARSDDASVSSYDGHQLLSAAWRPTIGNWRWSFETRRDRVGRHDPNQFRPLIWLAPWTGADWDSAPGARAERHEFHRASVRPDEMTEAGVDWTADRSVFGIDGVRDRRDRVGATLKRHLTGSFFVEGDWEYERREREGGASLAVTADGSTQRLTVGGRAHGRVNWSLEGRRRVDREQFSANTIRLLGLRPRVQGSLGPLNVLLETDGTWVHAELPAPTLSALLAEGRPPGFSLTEFCEVRWQLPGQVSLRSRFHADVRDLDSDRWRWEVSTVARF